MASPPGPGCRNPNPTRRRPCKPPRNGRRQSDSSASAAANGTAKKLEPFRPGRQPVGPLNDGNGVGAADLLGQPGFVEIGCRRQAVEIGVHHSADAPAAHRHFFDQHKRRARRSGDPKPSQEPFGERCFTTAQAADQAEHRTTGGGAAQGAAQGNGLPRTVTDDCPSS